MDSNHMKIEDFIDGLDGLSITEDMAGQEKLKSITERAISECSLTWPLMTDVDGGFVSGRKVQDGQTISNGSATLAYDDGQQAWVLQVGGAPAEKVMGLLSCLDSRFHIMALHSQLPLQVAVRPDSPDYSVVKNDFG